MTNPVRGVIVINEKGSSIFPQFLALFSLVFLLRQLSVYIYEIINLMKAEYFLGDSLVTMGTFPVDE